ncbi:LCP family protein [Streptomyces sp. NPDC051784]|uniref:LCP family protein n=1 Tax=Streptomyces sp. NPDC051784 TaxID=3155805 RepID=UPI0034151501
MTTDQQAAPRRSRRKAPEPRRARRHAGGEQPTGRRRTRGRLRLALILVLSVVVLVTAGAGWLYLHVTGNIDTFGAEGVAKNRPDAASSKGENVLVIGSDARTGSNADLGCGDKGDIGRSDTAFLLHVYADHRHAVAVSIPRDTLVTIPSCKLPDGTWTEEQPDTMFNAAYSVGQTAKGNPACTQNTVEKLTGLRVDHTVVVDFQGFASLTDVVGGVKVCLPQDVYQSDLNPNRTTRGSMLFSQGEQTVSGEKALDYVRIRHGIGDGSDIGRIKRQQAFMSSLITKIKDGGFTPTKLLPLAEAATSSMTVDPRLGSADKLLTFAMSLRNVDLHNTQFATVPWRYEGNRVAVVEPDASALWAALKNDRTLDGSDASGKNGDPGKESTAATSASRAKTTDLTKSTAPTETSGKGISVAVYNGTTTEGLASRATRTLQKDGYTVTATGNADSQGHTTTVIRYGPGDKLHAKALAELFPGADLESVGTGGLSLILGSDYTGEVPKGLADDARSADANPCSNLSYG